jgi:glycosyltransferase involved in cell wall biosynthesis
VLSIALVRDTRLEVVGGGPMLQTYRDLAADLGISSRVSFLGPQPFADVTGASARAGVVCIPSLLEEPFGFVAADAMAKGRPLVVIPSGALAELCAVERGFVTPDRDPRSIASTLEAALAYEVERVRRAERTRTFELGRLTLGRSGDAYGTLYDEVAG